MLLLFVISIIILAAVAALVASTPSTFLFDLIDSTFSDGSSTRQR